MDCQAEFSHQPCSQGNPCGPVEATGCREMAAVSVTDLYLGYQNNGLVLNGVNMKVSPASIYGLLGPSGCGKTSLIKCLVGYFRPSRGSIIIYGYPPGHHNLNIPGVNVGYMPQECIMYDELTIGETLKYFARLFLMDEESIEKSVKHLIDILDLPEANRLVSRLSGGQKRRVSFAASVIHKPKLMILDEPTAGVDPIVAASIWKHLKRLSTEFRVAVVLTTHYIEEARRANRVGLMRGGQILQEDDPRTLMNRFNASTLEQVFLQICTRNKKNQAQSDQEHSEIVISDLFVAQIVDTQKPIQKSNLNSPLNPVHKPKAGVSPLNFQELFTANLTKWFAMVLIIFWKNTLRNIRNPLFMVFQFVVPIMPVVLCCLAIGLDPFDIRIGIVDEDKTQMSRKFLNQLDGYYLNAVPYHSVDEALKDIKAAETWGVLFIRRNFTRSFLERRDLSNLNLNNSIIEASKVLLYADLTNELVNVYVQRSLDQSFYYFVKETLKERGLRPSIASLPIRLEEAVFGEESRSRHDNFKRFQLPGLMVIVCFSMGFSLTALIITLERNDNMFDRHYVIGITPLQILTAHLMNRQISNVIQITTILFVCVVFLGVVDLPPLTTLCTAFLALFVSSISGMCLGMVFATTTSKMELIITMSLTALFALLIASGVIWPLESMRPWLRHIAIFSPVAQGARSLQYILLRGEDIWARPVYTGLVNNFLWAALFFGVGIRQFKFTT